jgi:hypothetical protein
MALSTEELLLASRARRSPFQALALGALQGFQTGLSQAPDREQARLKSENLSLENEGLRIRNQAAATEQAASQQGIEELRRLISQQAETQTRDNFVSSSSNAAKPVTPSKKFEITRSLEGGKYKIQIKEAESTAPDKLKTYTPEQVAAINSGDFSQISRAFGGGAPGDALKHAEAVQRMGNMQQERQQREEERRKARFDVYYKEIERDPQVAGIRKRQTDLAVLEGLMNEVKQSGNQIAAAQIGARTARVVGEVGVLTDNDVRRYVEAGSIDRKYGDKLSRMIHGVPSDLTLQELETTYDIMRRKTEQILADRARAHIEKSASVEKMKPEELAGIIKVPYFAQQGGGGGAGNDALAEKRAALRAKLGLGGKR